jgi:hypothetical protein
MKKQLLTAFLLLTVCSVMAQTTRKIEVESKVESTSEVTIKGKRVPYKATAGTQPVWDEKGEPIASLFYTYYERTDVVDRSKRPLAGVWGARCVACGTRAQRHGPCWRRANASAPRRLARRNTACR